MSRARENAFQGQLIRELHELFPGCMVLKNDTEYCQGIPDLLILFGPHWAILECKRAFNSDHEPNQDYYVEMLNDMSYSAFIYPENKDQVLHELQSALRPCR